MQENARSLRSAIRQHQMEDGYLNLLHALAKDCFQHGWSPEVARKLLNEICANLGASHGFIAINQKNTLEVLASMGDSYPQAARIPVLGKIAMMLKTPCQFETHLNIQAVAPHKIASTVNTVTLPIVYRSVPLGIIVLALSFSALNAKQRQLGETICGFLGAMMSIGSTTQATAKDLSVIDILTPREREVFALLPSGKSNAELGVLLGIASGTVKIHVERILSKLNLNDRTQAAVKAVELGYSSSENFSQ